VTLADEYQFAWRSWDAALHLLPRLHGTTVFDMGCGIGDLSAELAARGARVVGFDENDELLQAARARCIPDASFRRADLRSLSCPGAAADGLWCSFTAAYFVRLDEVLAQWRKLLRPHGWIAMVEVDELFGHEPVRARTRTLLDGYAREAFMAARYDAHMGGKLAGFLAHAGFTDCRRFELEDQELSFEGPAGPEILKAWEERFFRMAPLRDFCGAEYVDVRDDFLACLGHERHRFRCRVRGAFARRPR
jgi:SAM-dependent methyltransferase